VKSLPVALVLLLGVAEFAFSQDSLSAKPSAWIGFIYGPCQGSHFEGHVWGETLNYVSNGQIFSFRFLVAQRGRVSGFSTPFHAYYKRISSIVEMSMLYGFVLRNRFMLFSGSAGIGFIDFKTASPPSIKSVAFPFAVQMQMNPTRIIGVGIFFFGNLNPKTPYDGVAFSVQIGYL